MGISAPRSPAPAQDKGLKVAKQTKAEQRVALVIGNGRYKASPLRNPVNDAKAMAETLGEVGFEVTSKYNLAQKELKRAIKAFGKKLKKGGVGLFYYSGHGMQVNGTNYLIPVDAEVESEADVDIEAVPVGAVLARMQGARNRLNIVILDACRNNPFATSFRSASKGLSFMNAPSGTLIAYATAPGSVAADGDGENGVYTFQLLRHMTEPDLTIEQVFKKVRSAVKNSTGGNQIPWESTALEGEFCFKIGTADRSGITGKSPGAAAVDAPSSGRPSRVSVFAKVPLGVSAVAIFVGEDCSTHISPQLCEKIGEFLGHAFEERLGFTVVVPGSIRLHEPVVAHKHENGKCKVGLGKELAVDGIAVLRVVRTDSKLKVTCGVVDLASETEVVSATMFVGVYGSREGFRRKLWAGMDELIGKLAEGLNELRPAPN